MDWQKGKWPLVKGYQTIEDCGKLCLATKRCKAFHVADADKKSKTRFQCFLFGHKGVQPASGVPGACFGAKGKVTLSPQAKKRQEAEKEAKEKTKQQGEKKAEKKLKVDRRMESA